jgi:uncharacterized membrane protein
MTQSFLETAFSSDAWQLFGRFHVLTVHLPIGLLLVGGIIELHALVRRKPSPSPAAEACILFGAFAAVVSAVMGWAHADYAKFASQADTLFWHRWIGVGSAVIALGVLALQQRAKRVQKAQGGEARAGALVRVYQIGAIASAVMVGIAGHFGGTLTHGADYFTIAVEEAKQREESPKTLPTDRNAFASAQPILVQFCYNCHAGDRVKAGLRVDSVQAILRGGDSGPSIIPGDSEKSLLIQRVRGLGDEQRMPPKGPGLTTDQIAILRAWIDAGAKE